MWGEGQKTHPLRLILRVWTWGGMLGGRRWGSRQRKKTDVVGLPGDIQL
jgi:hypothetical protein